MSILFRRFGSCVVLFGVFVSTQFNLSPFHSVQLQAQEALPALDLTKPSQKVNPKQTAEEIELLRQQVEVLQERLNLLIEHQQEVTDTLDKRSLQSIQREASLRNEIDNAREMLDTTRRDADYSRVPLRETHNTFRSNQSPFWFGGTLAGGYTDLDNKNSTFLAETLSPHFYLLLNEHFLIESNPEITAGGDVEIESAQLDYFMNDNVTLVFGRFYAPIGFMNERLHTSWIYKTPDKPIMFQQVFPSTTSLQGMQIRGARYVADLPLKAEYAFFAANGYSTNDLVSNSTVAANLRAMDALGADVNNDKAFGGRLGMQIPTIGLISGVSMMHNGAYDRDNQFNLELFDIDASLRQGNWDLNFEAATVHQETPAAPIRRFGMYAQAAYRNYASRHPVVEKLEYVVRYENVDFKGISTIAANATNALDRNRYSAGVNFYPYPSLVYKLHYIFDDEHSQRSTQGLYANVSLGF